jgi:hypothetical protein
MLLKPALRICRSACSFFDVKVRAALAVAALGDQLQIHLRKDPKMRVMVIVKANQDSEAGKMPSQQLLTDMGQFNQQLMKAGVFLDAGGLQPSSQGKRVRFSGSHRTVADGPFAEAKELVGGFWIWQVRSMEEAVEWVKRCPNPHEGEGVIEIRKLFEAEDFAQQS